jgi:anti-sigma factor RsiW
VTPDDIRPEAEELACIELVELVTEYLEGAMPAPDRERFEAHLGGCPYCIEYVEQMRQIDGGLGALADDTIAPQTRAELLAAFRGWRER